MSKQRRGKFRKTLKKKNVNYEDERFEEEEERLGSPAQLHPQLNKYIDRILGANDPNAPDNICRYNFVERRYKPDPNVEQMAIHYSCDSDLIPEKGEEARFQAEAREKKEREREEQLKEGRRTLNNQFNCSDRATQTFVNPVKSVQEQTEPPATRTFEATATQWEIYDTYMEHFRQQKNLESKGKKKRTDDDEGETALKKVVKKKSNREIMHSEDMKITLKITERMVNQNTHSDLLEDFKFWEDASDAFKEKGTLLPLWTFSPDRKTKKKRKQVTALCWNPKYPDLFVVGYGSYDFLKQGNGMVCCYSLKNPSHFEYQFTTSFGVTCLDFHPMYPSLLAVGTYDGVVSIYDVKQKGKENPIAKSDVKNGKHTDPVWSVKWENNQKLEFHSISSDGRVTFWCMNKNELQFYDVMKLRIDNMLDQFDVDSSQKKKKNQGTLVGQTISGLASGTCFDFHRSNSHIFLVGTEEGTIHKCSKAYSSQYLFTYEGHNMSVYAVKWNKFDDNLFLSASADWTVKIWDQSKYEPLQSFDLQSSVGDISWAPYSASVFSAVTNDGRVHVYDLNKNKNDALCDQLIVKRAKLTHIQFNVAEPIILVGDDKGQVQILKLSPKLKKKNDKIHPII